MQVSLHRILLMLSIFAICSGCVVIQAPTPQSISKEENGPAVISRAEEPRIMTVADAVQTCKNIQKAQDIPVGCVTKYFDERPAMYFVFENMSLAEVWIKPLAEFVAQPYCQSANNSGREAFLVLALNNPKLGKIFRCENWEWGDWFSLESRDEEPKVKTVSEAIRFCKKVQQSNEIPIACKPTYLNEMPALAIGFQNQSALEKWLDPVLEYFGMPFCNAANQSNRQAFLIFLLKDERASKAFNCETQDSTEWISNGGEYI